jgi:dTDP-4-dehydrorhamnose reductase
MITDYVFDGAKVSPYVETDATNPLNVYGASKVAGETMVRNYAPKHYIIRSSGPFGGAGASGKRGNFVETIVKKDEGRRNQGC